jgi:copper chaperone CopZ
MRSEYCKRAIFTALTPIGGIHSADVSLGTITVEHDGTVTEQDLRDAIAVTGYVIVEVAEDRRVLPMANQTLHEHRI